MKEFFKKHGLKIGFVLFGVLIAVVGTLLSDKVPNVDFEVGNRAEASQTEEKKVLSERVETFEAYAYGNRDGYDMYFQNVSNEYSLFGSGIYELGDVGDFDLPITLIWEQEDINGETKLYACKFFLKDLDSYFRAIANEGKKHTVYKVITEYEDGSVSEVYKLGDCIE